MSAARERILSKVRAAVSDGRDDDWRVELDRRMKQPPDLIRPKLPADLLGRFSEKLQAGGGTLEQVGTKAEVAATITQFLESNELPLKIRAAPALRDTDWGDGMDVSYGSTRGDDLVSATPAFCAVAETGSVVLLSGEASPTTLNFLPDVHVVVLARDQLVSHIEDVWVKLRALGEPPRTVNFITGPSKTADVEQTLQIGAHGPRRLHVVLVNE